MSKERTISGCKRDKILSHMTVFRLFRLQKEGVLQYELELRGVGVKKLYPLG